MADNLGTVSNARSPEQIAHMKETVGKGRCPFCPPDPEKNIEILGGKHWVGWANPFPYPNHSHHFVLATREHLIDIEQISPEMAAELFVHIQAVKKKYDLPGLNIVMRDGPEQYTAGTLRHLHVHVQLPDRLGPAFAVFGKINGVIDIDKQRELLVGAFTPRT